MSDITLLEKIMARLRDPDGGCPWDIEQSYETIAPYTVEEAYEVADAIERGDMAALRDELGDLLLQVVYHSRMAEEDGHFTLAEVIAAICDKMVRRHPHVFGDGEPGPGWEALKEKERQDGAGVDHGALAGVAHALPALLRAQKIQRRAARVGFDWDGPEGPRAKILEELDELDRSQSAPQREEEMGDLLFAAVNLARHLDIDAEQALRRATAKFEARFAAVEERADRPLAELDLAELERLWRAAKRSERERAYSAFQQS